MCNIATFQYCLFICCFHVGIRLCDAVTITGGTFHKNKRMVADTIFSVDNIGLRMCIREAMRYKSCTGVNYWHNKLQCKLLSWDQSISNLIVSLDDQLIDSPGHVYTDIDSWTMNSDSCWPNPCPEDTKCALSKSNGYVCLSYDCRYSCGFESEASCTCIFKNSLQDNFDWTRHSGGTPSSNTGPTKAAEGSYYMYTEVSSIASGSRAVLTTESASLTTSSFCLSFQYHMKGLPGTLKVFAGDKTSSLTSIWEKSGVQPNPDQWKNVTIEIPQFNNPVITIEGTRGDSRKGDIAIDDLILKTPGR